LDVVWDGITQESTLQPEGVTLRHALADAAKAYDWDTVFDIVENEPELINTTRPGGVSQFAPLHQVAHGGATVDVVERMQQLGAFRSARTAKGERPVDIAVRKGHDRIVRALTPSIYHDVPSSALQALQKSFHKVIRARAKRLVDEHSLRLPDLEVLVELEEPRMWFPVPGMYGGFHFWLEAGGTEPVLISESWCRVADGSGQRHEVRCESSILVDEGFV
jgi:hypothetical protein